MMEATLSLGMSHQYHIIHLMQLTWELQHFLDSFDLSKVLVGILLGLPNQVWGGFGGRLEDIGLSEKPSFFSSEKV